MADRPGLGPTGHRTGTPRRNGAPGHNPWRWIWTAGYVTLFTAEEFPLWHFTAVRGLNRAHSTLHPPRIDFVWISLSPKVPRPDLLPIAKEAREPNGDKASGLGRRSPR